MGPYASWMGGYIRRFSQSLTSEQGFDTYSNTTITVLGVSSQTGYLDHPLTDH